MLTKVNDVIVQCLWRHSWQFKSPNVLHFLTCTCSRHFENSSGTHA